MLIVRGDGGKIMQEHKAAAQHFAEYWKGKGYEKGESQKFWLALLSEVFGVEHAAEYISFENQVQLDHTSFIDGYIEATHVLIEQKSIEKDLDAKIKQSDGKFLTPFEQAKRYAAELSYSKRPRWVVTCNFRQFYIYDMERPQDNAEVLLLENLPEEYSRLNFLIDSTNANVKRQETVSLKAGELVGRIYEALAKKYDNPEDEETKKSLNKLCVRIVFCLYAEDAGLFKSTTSFHDYLASINPEYVGMALQALFKVLNTPSERRKTLSQPRLKDFPYVNGGLFADEDIEIPSFDEEIVKVILEDCSADFNWAQISPTIFGSIFESTLNPETRRSGGMHYTSIENIHKVIDPLFLDDLTAELNEIKAIKTLRMKKEKLLEYQEKLASLKFLDPACGSGNFLTESYICLRRLENEVINLYYNSETGQKMLLTDNIIKVKISQFYGIEINDFAVAVAKTALYIAESQMLEETASLSPGSQLSFLPLSRYENIIEANALRTDWNTVVPKAELNFIMGNPPFVGARVKNAEQTKDIEDIFGKDWKGSGNLDYVACWYKKAADFITDTQIKCAFVSTNSITQGEQVAVLWKKLFTDGLHFNFAYRTFIWDSEANEKAHVYCVIIGFGKSPTKAERIIFSTTKIDKEFVVTKHTASNINPYLIDADDVFIGSRNAPICDVPKIGIGNKPIDNGNYLFTETEYQDFIRKEPKSKQYFRRIYGSEEFINNKIRYCLWLGDCSVKELLSMPECMKRVDAVRKYRLASRSPGTVKLADKPTKFHVENISTKTYLLIPSVSSEKRKYIPIGFMSPDTMATNLVLISQEAEPWHFAVLTSSVHMAWVSAVCGRLEMRYRYSAQIVYNNFPWPVVSEKQKQELNKTAQAILDARAKHKDCSLADMYGEHMHLFESLTRAHKANDKAVLKAYGLPPDTSEEDILAFLMKRYRELTNEQ